MAKYAGICRGCGERFEVGDLVRYDDDNEIVTERCAGRSDVAAMSPSQVKDVRRKMCLKCFCVHAGECT
jgi:hypothetical protein